MVIAFDSKEYRREREIDGVRKTLFYSPLGVGVDVSISEELYEEYRKLCDEKRKGHAIYDDCYIFSSGYLSKKYGPSRTCSFLESIIFGLSEYIDCAFFSYVILPPNKIPTVTVGGTYSASTEIDTLKFLTKLNPMFSYITAWNYYKRPRSDEQELWIDSFSSLTTLAWHELSNKHPLKIYPHGDECNLAISLADAIAYVTDRRLDRRRLRLDPDSIDEVWHGLNIKTETRFLTQDDLIYYRWYDYNPVDWKMHQARPILFMDAQALNMKTMVNLDPYKAAIEYISKRGGSLQGFDLHMDSDRIRDGDIYVYAGEEAKNRAETFRDMFDLDVFSIREIRQAIQQQKRKTY